MGMRLSMACDGLVKTYLCTVEVSKVLMATSYVCIGPVVTTLHGQEQVKQTSFGTELWLMSYRDLVPTPNTSPTSASESAPTLANSEATKVITDEDVHAMHEFEALR